MRKFTLSVSISAHNEEDNIANLLKSIVSQRSLNYNLKKVIVVCDGCTDNTAKIAQDFAKKYNFIKVIDGKKRLGKAERLNSFYRNNRSDIFLTLDADIVIANKNVFTEIVKAFDNPKVGLVGGSSLPVSPKTFSEKIVYRWQIMWSEMKNLVENGQNIHNNLGCISALS